MLLIPPACENASEQDKQDALRVAVQDEDVILVSCFQTEGIKPTSDDFLGALGKASHPILEMFLKNGYDINSPLRDDFSPPLA